MPTYFCVMFFFFPSSSPHLLIAAFFFYVFHWSFCPFTPMREPCCDQFISRQTFELHIYLCWCCCFFFFCHFFPRRFKAYYSLFLLFLSSHPFLVFFNLQFDGKVFVWVSNYACYIVTEANVEELGSNICKVLDSLWPLRSLTHTLKKERISKGSSKYKVNGQWIFPVDSFATRGSCKWCTPGVGTKKKKEKKRFFFLQALVPSIIISRLLLRLLRLYPSKTTASHCWCGIPRTLPVWGIGRGSLTALVPLPKKEAVPSCFFLKPSFSCVCNWEGLRMVFFFLDWLPSFHHLIVRASFLFVFVAVQLLLVLVSISSLFPIVRFFFVCVCAHHSLISKKKKSFFFL